KLLHVSVVFLLLFASQVFAQNRTITGTVTAKEDGLPLPGVSVRVQGTNTGTVTGPNGKFTIEAAKGSILTFTFIGYDVQNVPVGNTANLTITLTVNSRQLSEVIVTGALGIKRQAKELGYAATNITSKSITETHPTNFTNGLTAKAPGLVISTLDNGINPSTRFTLRGNRHINGNNYALVVLDGVPVSPNDVNTINPDDIESVNILNGAGAAALYGSEASNGALIISTKRGSPNGAPQITYSNTFQAESISYFPKLQTSFGGYGGEGPPFQDPVTGFITTQAGFENQSYGPAYNGQLMQLGIPLANGTIQQYPYSTPSKDPRRAFFNTGYSDQHNLSYSVGDANNSLNVAVNRLDKTGVVPYDTYDRTVARLSGTRTTGILKLDASLSYSEDHTSTYGAGYSGSLLSTLFNTPSWVPLQNFKDPTAPFADPSTYFNSYGINPYWIVKNSRQNRQSNVFNGSFSAVVKPTEWLDATYRLAATGFGVYQSQSIRQEADFSTYALSDPTGGSAYKAASNPGTVSNYTQYGDGSNFTGSGPQGYSRLQQDAYINLHHTFYKDFKVNLLLGNTIWQTKARTQNDQSSNLLIPEFYNIGLISGAPTVSQNDYFVRQIGVYGALNIGYKDIAFIQATGRNDWDSRLSKTKRSLFYPSISGSFVFTNAFEALKNNKILSYGKLRAAVSKVGQVSIAPYSINNTFSSTSGFPYGGLGGLSLGTTNNNPLLEPEFINEKEFAIELGLFNNRVNLNATYYKQNSKNQTLSVQTSASTGFNQATINAGEIANNGYEFELNGTVLPVSQNSVGLKLGGNLGIYNSEVVSLLPGSSQFQITQGSTTAVYAVVGQPYPSLLGTDYKRDNQGRVVVDASGTTAGYPQLGSGLTNFGRTTPKYVLGLNMSATYKFVTLSAVAEYKSGYVILNSIASTLDFGGISATSASADRQRFIYPNSVIETSPGVYVPNTTVPVVDGNYGFWQSSNYGTAATPFVTSAAFWKIREMTLNFNLTQFINKTKAIKALNFALTGRNLFLFRPKDNPYTDPEYNLDTSNATGVTNANQTPPTRIFGANLQITF
ncbi:MAG: SusC/RagA family TonB-linked outer membrane protein, partial [Sphingobacteriaceae bacterium]